MAQKRACDTCHKRKIQCDSTNQNIPCNWCEHHGLACTFNRVRGRKKRARQIVASTSKHTLSERLKRVEESLSRTIARQKNQEIPIPVSAPSTSSTPTTFITGPEPEEPQAFLSLGEHCASYDSPTISQATSPLAGHASSVSFGQIYCSGRRMGYMSQQNGIPVFSQEGQEWIAAITGEDIESARFPSSNFKPLSSTLSMTQFSTLPAQTCELPDERVLMQITDVYFSSVFRLVFPVLDQGIFEETIALAYQPADDRPSISHITARCCVFAFLSIIGLFQGIDDIPNIADIDSDLCAIKAHYLLTDVYENPTIVSLQAVFLLHMHQTFTGRLDSSAMLNAIACRLVFMLGGHFHRDLVPYGQEATRQERETRQLRMLFWLCYIFDKDVALRLSQPPLMAAEYCDLTLPEEYENYYDRIPSTEEEMMAQGTRKDILPHFPGDPQLSQLKDKTARLLYSAHAARKSDAELLRDIRELDDELEKWRLAIPPDFRPALSISTSQVYVPDNILPRSMRRILLHLEYHHLMTSIHRASGRCIFPRNKSRLEGSEWKGGVESSMALSLEASRSTINYLRTAVHGLAGQAFWVVVFYPTSAIVLLFLHILMEPLDPQSKADLELLCSASDLIRSIPVRRLTTREVSYMKLADSFAAHVIRLGKCAIAKATREREVQSIGISV